MQYSTKERKFTKINVWPSRKDFNLLKKRYKGQQYEHVIHEGAEDNRYLVEVIIAHARYQALTQLNYIEPPDKPPLVHGSINELIADEEQVELKAKNKERLEQWWPST